MAPECPSGVVFLGERGKIVSVSPSRFAAVTCTPGGLSVQLHASVPGEKVTVAVGVGGKVVGCTLVQPASGQGAVGACTAQGSVCKQDQFNRA